MTRTFHGEPAAPGQVIGRVFLFESHEMIPRSTGRISPAAESRRVESALRSVLYELESGITGNDPAAQLSQAHLLILQDGALLDAIRQSIAERGRDAVSAVQEAVSELSALIAQLDDPYFAARSADVRDAGERLLHALTGENPDTLLDTLPPETVLTSRELTPSQVARLDPACVRAIILEGGSPLAHAAILAGSMGIAMVCNLGRMRLEGGELCVVDGDAGTVIMLESGQMPPDARELRPVTIAETSDVHEARLADGTAITLLGNVNTPADLARIVRTGLGGVGLLRTEFLFPRHTTPPTVEEQSALFVELLGHAPDGIFTVRALDVGGDKRLPWLHLEGEKSALRGMRLLLERPELIVDQYCALLRALALTNRPDVQLRFLLPMVSSAEEIQAVRGLIQDARAQERERQSEYRAPAPDVALGAMIETPAAVLMAPEIAHACDFLSIGTNDLAHFLFATDRAQRDPSGRVDPLHPTVLRAVKMVCDAANEAGIPVSLCGEVAGNPAAAPILVGLGVTELSLRAATAPLVHAALGRYTLEECKAAAQTALGYPDPYGT